MITQFLLLWMISANSIFASVTNPLNKPIGGNLNAGGGYHTVEGINNSVALRRTNSSVTSPDNLKYLLDRLSIISRLANGISLQSGLMNGSIPIDAAAGELLNFGSVKVSDIASINSIQVSSFVEQLKGLPSAFQYVVESAEKVHIANGIRIRSESVTIPDKATLDKYYGTLEKYSDNIDFKSVVEAYQNLNTITDILKKIKEINVDGDEDDKQVEFTQTFPPLVKIVNPTVNKLKKLKQLAPNLNNLNVLINSENIYSPIGTMIALAKDRHQLTTDPELEKIQDYIDQIKELKSLLLNGSSVDILKLREMVDSRTNTFKNKKTFTNGFGNGVSDVIQLDSDIMDPWLKSISGPNVSIQMLSNGLFPLFQLGKQLNGIDGKLKSLSSSDDSMNYLSDIVEKINSFPTESIDVYDYIYEIQDQCDGYFVEEDVIKGSQEVVDNIKKFKKALVGLNAAINRADPTKDKKIMDDFIKSLGFTNIQNSDQSVKELVGVLNKIRKDGTLERFKKEVEKMKKGLDIDKKQLDTIKNSIISNKTKLIFDNMDREIKIHECFQERKSKFEVAIPAIDTLVTLKKLDSSKIEKIEKVIEVIGTVSKDLQTISSIPNEMKKQMKPEVGEINKMKNSKECSETIGLSVGLVRNAFEFQSIPIGDLQSADSYLKGVIDKMKNKKKKNEIIDSWGNHSEYISILQSSIQIIKNYGNTLQLNDQSTIPDYGSSLQKLSEIKDIQVDTKTTNLKLKALDMVPNDSKLKNTRSILNHLNSMDLQFSSYLKQLQATQKAIQDLFGFFTSFSNEISDPIAFSGDADSEKGGIEADDWKKISGIAGGVLVVIAIGVGSYFVYNHLQKKALRKAIKIWISDQLFEEEAYADAYRFHEAAMKAMTIHAGKPDEKAALEYLPVGKHRNAKERFCKPETALHHLMMDGKKMPIHANLVECPNGMKFYATQAPMMQMGDFEDTKEDFWHMCMHDKVEMVVMLIQPDKHEVASMYFPIKLNDEETYGRYHLKTTKIVKEWKNFKDIVVRKILVTDTTGKFKSRTISHYNYTTWRDMMPPTKLVWEPFDGLLVECKKSKKPIVVHCVSGIGRTMSFIGLQFIAEKVAKDPKITMVEALLSLRALRYDAIQTLRQCYWLQLSVCEKLNKDYKLGMEEELKQMRELAIEVCENERGTPEFEERRRQIREERARCKALNIQYQVKREDTSHLGEVVPY